VSDPETPLSVERVTVGEKSVEIVVRASSERGFRTRAYPQAVEIVLSTLPGLARHRCECGSAHGIEAELRDTELPHLLEHVILELMVLSGSPRTLAGRTTWDFKRDGRGVFNVSIEYDDDLVALGAVRTGTDVVSAAVAGETLPDMEHVVTQLRGLRSVPAD
jgi:hypothetical protein